MTEADLRAQLDEVKAQRATLKQYGDAWAEAGYEMARITEQIRRLLAAQAVEKRTSHQQQDKHERPIICGRCGLQTIGSGKQGEAFVHAASIAEVPL